MTWTTLGVLEWTTQKFAERNISSARLEAQVLLAHVLACTRVQLYTAFDKPLGEDELAGYRALIKRRLAGEPLAYLVGETEFWSLPFTIDASVLVPRPDTETVVEVALTLRGDKAVACRVLDLCTGSGVLAVSLARELPAARVIATELSADAAAVARRNAERNGVADRVDVRVGDLFAPVAGESSFDLVVANPPYIATAGDRDARRRGPSRAAPRARRRRRRARVLRPHRGRGAAHLAPGGALVLEHGFDQADAVAGRLTAAGLVDVTLTRDLAKQPRVTSARRAP